MPFFTNSLEFEISSQESSIFKEIQKSVIGMAFDQVNIYMLDKIQVFFFTFDYKEVDNVD